MVVSALVCSSTNLWHFANHIDIKQTIVEAAALCARHREIDPRRQTLAEGERFQLSVPPSRTTFFATALNLVVGRP
jgi:hypothetical protein